MEFLIILILVVLFIRWLMIRSRFQDLEEKLRDLEGRVDNSGQVRELTARIYQLEIALRQGVVQSLPAAESLVEAEPFAPPPPPRPNRGIP